MKRAYTILFLSVFVLLQVSAHNINQRQLTDSLRAYAARHAVLEARIRINSIRQSNGYIRLNTNDPLSSLAFTPQMTKEIKRMVRQVVGLPSNTRVEIYTNGYEIEQLISSQYLPPTRRRQPYTIVDKERPLVRNTTIPYSTSQGLNNKYIALWASHGRFYDQKENRWRWQRANIFETVEDLLTSSFTMPFLVPMLENAGATVIQPRERDTQINEVVMEGTDAIGDDRKAWFLPDIPKAGRYAVYAWWEQDSHYSDQVTYTVMHDGYETPIEVNQHIGGHTWIYLGTFYFHAGQSQDNGVCITGLGNKHTNLLAHCRMKFGGGMGSIIRNSETAPIGMTSELPRWMEGSRYWLQYAGIPDSVYSQTEGKNDYTDDFTSRGRWLNYICGGSPAHPDSVGLKIPINVGLAFHTDAGVCGGDTTKGTLTIYTDYNNHKRHNLPTGQSRLTIRDYADRVQTQVVEDIRRVYAPEWNRRELYNASYSETRNPEVPTIILEVLAHQNPADIRYGHDPRFKFLVSRAVYKGILKYIADSYGFDYVVQPLPINSFALQRIGSDSIRLSWQATNDTLEQTAVPTYYIVYQQTNEGEWSPGIKTTKTHITFPLEKGKLMAYKVAAGNNGGISLDSEILAAYRHNDEKGTALIINGFTRLCAPEYVQYDNTHDGFSPERYGIAYGKDISFTGKQYEFWRELKWKSDDDPGFGASYHDYIQTLEVGNTFDYPILHGKAIAKQGYSFVSQSADAVMSSAIDSTYSFVDLILGKQKQTTIGQVKKTTAFKSFPQPLRQAIIGYTSTGGSVLVSGSYIASDMLGQADKRFVQDILHYKFVSSAATQHGIINMSSNNTQYQLLMRPNEIRIPCEAPDGISPCGDGATTIAQFADSKLGAAVAYNGRYKSVALSFPLESISEERHISQIMQYIIQFFEKQ